MAMVRAVKALKKAGLAGKVRLIMNIHDALEFEVRKDVPPALVIAALQPALVLIVAVVLLVIGLAAAASMTLHIGPYE